MPAYRVSSSENVVSFLGKENCFKTMPNEVKNKLFFGVELELQLKGNSIDGSKCAEALNSANDTIGKHSIFKTEWCCCGGFEIVTIPATLNYHRQVLWGKFFEQTAPLMQAANGCGIHVHFSRHALTVSQLAKMLYFVHARENNVFLDKIACREHTKYATMPKQYVKGKEKSIIDSETDAGRNSLSVSSRNAGQSCEFRIFRSQDTRTGVIRTIEFTAALIEYFGLAEDDAKALTYEKFLTWFKASAKSTEYPDLHNHLVNLGYLKSNISIYEMLGARIAI